MVERLGALRHRTFRSLAERNYRRFVVGHTSSVIGTWMQRIGQDWLILELTDSAVALGLSMLFQYLPVLLLSVWGGVVVDRVDTRRLLMTTQAAQGALAAALAVVTLTGVATVGMVYALAALLGIVTAFDNPGRQSFVAELVDGPDIVNALALNSLVNNVGRLVGPAIAGILIATVGVGITFVVNAVSFVAVLASLVLMDLPSLRPAPVSPRAPRQAREGLSYVWHHPELRATVALVAIVSIFAQHFRVVFPLLATETFNGDSRTYGWLTAALGAGAIVGALLGAGATKTTSWRLLWVCVAFAGANLAVAAAPGLAVAMMAIVVLGVLNILFNTLGRTILQLNTAPTMRGRVMAIHVMVFLGGIPVGGPLIGFLCEWWGPRQAMVVAGGMSLLGCAVVWPAVRRLRDQWIPHAPVDESPGMTHKSGHHDQIDRREQNMGNGVGLLGLGKMGMPMARHLVDAGYDVYGYDVRPEVVDAAVRRGITMADSPADVARNVAATLVVVGFDEEVEDVCLGPRGLIEGAPSDAVVFLCSTIAPDTSHKIGDRMSKRGVHVLDATLCRAEHAAVDGTLLVLGGGDEKVFAEWDAAFHTFASDVYHLGDLGAGQIGKMLNNLLLWINVSGNQEALRLGERLGIAQEKLIPALMLGSGANWALGTWHKSRPMPWAEKDLSICLDYADRVGLPMPLSGVTREVIKQLKQDKAAVSDSGTHASMQETVRAWETGPSGVTTG